MDTVPTGFDGAWKEALETYFEQFVTFFFPAAASDIDWTQAVAFLDTELQKVAPEESRGLQRVDKLVRVVRRGGAPAWVLVHIEVQSQHDEAFAERMFRYHARIFDRDRRQVVSLAVLGDPDVQWQPDQFGYALWGCDLRLRFPVAKLHAFDPLLLEQSPNVFAVLTLLHRDAQATRDDAGERLRRTLVRYRQLVRQRRSAAEMRQLLRLMEYRLRLPKAMAQQAWTAMQTIEQEEGSMTSFVTSFEEIGHERGLAEGRVEERRAMVLRQLPRRVGALSEPVVAQINALSAEELLLLGDALLDFASPADLDAWLAPLRP